MAEHSFIQDSDTLRLTYQDGATVLKVVKLCTKGLSQIELWVWSKGPPLWLKATSPLQELEGREPTKPNIQLFKIITRH